MKKREADLDIIILEIGLGGRRDVINIVEPSCSVITSIDIDELFKIINTKNNNFVPHGNDYYNFVLTEIKNYNCLK